MQRFFSSLSIGSPITLASQRAPSACTSGKEGELSSLIWRYSLDEEVSPHVCGMIRRTSLCISGQLWWRLYCYKQWPYKLCRLVDGKSDPLQVMRRSRPVKSSDRPPPNGTCRTIAPSEKRLPKIGYLSSWGTQVPLRTQAPYLRYPSLRWEKQYHELADFSNCFAN